MFYAAILFSFCFGFVYSEEASELPQWTLYNTSSNQKSDQTEILANKDVELLENKVKSHSNVYSSIENDHKNDNLWSNQSTNDTREEINSRIAATEEITDGNYVNDDNNDTSNTTSGYDYDKSVELSSKSNYSEEFYNLSTDPEANEKTDKKLKLLKKSLRSTNIINQIIDKNTEMRRHRIQKNKEIKELIRTMKRKINDILKEEKRKSIKNVQNVKNDPLQLLDHMKINKKAMYEIIVNASKLFCDTIKADVLRLFNHEGHYDRISRKGVKDIKLTDKVVSIEDSRRTFGKYARIKISIPPNASKENKDSLVCRYKWKNQLAPRLQTNSLTQWPTHDELMDIKENMDVYHYYWEEELNYQYGENLSNDAKMNDFSEY